MVREPEVRSLSNMEKRHMQKNCCSDYDAGKAACGHYETHMLHVTTNLNPDTPTPWNTTQLIKTH